jgi:hypothetical protein
MTELVKAEFRKWQVTDGHVSEAPEGRSKRCQALPTWEVAASASGAAPQTTTMSDTRPTERELEEAFIKITFRDEREDQNKDRLYTNWTENGRRDYSRRGMPVLMVLSSLRALE